MDTPAINDKYSIKTDTSELKKEIANMGRQLTHRIFNMAGLVIGTHALFEDAPGVALATIIISFIILPLAHNFFSRK